MCLQVLTHDDESLGEDRSQGSNQNRAFLATKAAWEETYRGQLYDIPGSGYIPIKVLHPVAQRMERLQGYFGRPIVQRTGAWLGWAGSDCSAWEGG